MLKVIVTGAYSTGKTMLVGELQKSLELDGFEVAVLPDVSRSCPLPLNSHQTDDVSLWLISTQVAREVAGKSMSRDILLCDRGVPDVLAHHEEVRSKIHVSRVNLLNTFLMEWLTTYDLILWSRVDKTIPIEADGLRVLDPNYRAMLDRFAARVLANVPNVFELPFGLDARLAYAREAMFARMGPAPRRRSST